MKLTDMTETTRTPGVTINEMNARTYADKKLIFDRYFSSGNNTNQSFSDKIELLTLICYLTQQLAKRNPEKYKTTKDTLDMVFENSIDWAGSDYIDGLAIISEDLMFGTTEIEKPAGFSNGKEIVARIQDLVNQWQPF